MKGILRLINDDTIGPPDACKDPSNPYEWAHLGWYLIKKIIPIIRSKKLNMDELRVFSKTDGSPFTEFEEEIEAFCRNELKRFYSNALFIGEESSPEIEFSQDDYVFVIDPIDGTRAFLSNYDTYSITISILKGRKPIFSIIANPASGNVAFRIDRDKSFMAMYNLENAAIECRELPLIDTNDYQPILVNVHPAVASWSVLRQLYLLWESKAISLVKSVSGSPSWQIMEVAIGSSIYINTWKQGTTMPFDLLAAFHILKGAGGVIVNFKGEVVDPWDVSNPFMAGLNENNLHILRRLMEERLT